MNSHAMPNEIVHNFCTTLLPGFRTIMKNLEELDNDLSPQDLAMQLMELGREQMSEVDDPSELDVELMTGYIESLNFDHQEQAFFTVFAGGCILGLVIINEVAREDFGRTLRLIEEFAKTI